MKKYLLMLIVAATLLVMPFNVYAGTKKVLGKEYETKNLTETLADEELEKEFSKYSENDNQIPIYLFRGKGCSFCRAFLGFINSITNEYGKYFKLVAFEVWYDENNWNLMQQVSYYMDKEIAGGVPYVIIGDKVFPGYANVYDEDIKTAIKTLYETPKKDRYDVFEKVEKDGLTSLEELQKIYGNGEGSGEGTEEPTQKTDNYSEETSKSSGTSSDLKIILWNLAFVAVGAIAVVIFVNFKFNNLEAMIEASNKERARTQEVASTKKVTKKK